MDIQPIIAFLHAIKNAWRNSNNKEAESRAEKISDILETGNFNSQKWEHEAKCDPPAELLYMNVSRKTPNLNHQRRASFPKSISMSTSENSHSKAFQQLHCNESKDVKSNLKLPGQR